ncbi:MAG: hypothetical protein K9M36_03225 [Candidatus Pacebacteria bacterium]|nr:hypothetical protein [Candidatus Paceibacterota bacterium]
MENPLKAMHRSPDSDGSGGQENREEIVLTEEKIQELRKKYTNYFQSLYEDWGICENDYLEDTLQGVPICPIFKYSKDINSRELVKITDSENPQKKYIINLDTEFLDYRSMGDPEILDLKTDTQYHLWLEKNKRENNLGSIMDYIRETYANTHHIPGIEYQQFLYDNAAVPEYLSITPRSKYLFVGSAFFDNGEWALPCTFLTKYYEDQGLDEIPYDGRTEGFKSIEEPFLRESELHVVLFPKK